MISIIIPVLNEEQTILALLNHLQKMSSGKQGLEVVIVDGGSTDQTLEVIAEYQMQNPELNLTPISGEKGRGKHR